MNLEELLESVRRVEIKASRLVNDTMVGAYLSQFKGRGLDFEELREYVPGDDVRDIDWNVTNRMGRPFVKRFREERELGVILLVDVSGSMAFGSGARNKREFAAEVAATLAFSAAHNGDKVGLLLFSHQVELYVPPLKGRKHILRILRELLVFEPTSSRTDIQSALRFLNHVLHRRCILFLLSDFLHESASAKLGKAQKRGLAEEVGLTNTRHELVCMHVYDPRESSLPAAGLVTLEDGETGELVEIDSGREPVRRQYAELGRNRTADLDSTLNRAGVDTVRLSTSEPFALHLQRFFELRRVRRRHQATGNQVSPQASSRVVARGS